jgi:CheY-like chemotaxis protein/anti-sigma regulatory factor (Ser/Thr protein kinase)
VRETFPKAIELRFDAPADLWSAPGDPTQLHQVLLNLVVNARDAMPEGGSIGIETRNVEVDEAAAQELSGVAPGKYVTVTVTDEGIGMDAETRAQLFEPFFTTKETGKGTGLGLSTVYGIVKQSEGAITVTSEPGSGSSFRVFLPRAEVPAIPIHALPVSPSGVDPVVGRASETILLVEDEPTLRSMTRQVLEENGYNVLEAPNGLDAIALSEKHEGPLHAVLTDVMMPHMSGAELAERIRMAHLDVKIVFMSGYTDESVFGQMPPDPNVTFVQKPYTPKSLLRILRETLDRARTLT